MGALQLTRNNGVTCLFWVVTFNGPLWLIVSDDVVMKPYGVPYMEAITYANVGVCISFSAVKLSSVAARTHQSPTVIYLIMQVGYVWLGRLLQSLACRT